MTYTTLLNYHSIDWLVDDVCLLNDLILDFYYSNLKQETGWFELAASITFVLQCTD